MSYIGNPIVSTDFPVDYKSGNGSTTAFTLSIAPASVNSIDVQISGVSQSPQTYSVSGTTLTFSAAPPTGTNNIVVRHLGIAGIPNVPAAGSVVPSSIGTGYSLWNLSGSDVNYTAGNVGIGVTPSAWNIGAALQIKSAGYYSGGSEAGLSQNSYYNAGWKYIGAGNATRYETYSGTHNWYTSASGTAGNAITFTQAMTLDASGNLLVGTTSTAVGTSVADGINLVRSNLTSAFGIGIQSNTTTGTQFFVGFARGAGTGVCGYISSSATNSTNYTTSSDYRLKENVVPMIGALDKVSALKPVTYNWKVDGSASEGFIAHELAEVCPAAVVGEKDAVDAEGKPVYQGIDTSFLVATLTAAIQELNAKVDAQALEIKALKGTV